MKSEVHSQKTDAKFKIALSKSTLFLGKKVLYKFDSINVSHFEENVFKFIDFQQERSWNENIYVLLFPAVLEAKAKVCLFHALKEPLW